MALEKFPVIPVAVGTAALAVDGLVASYDLSHNNGVAPAITKSMALKYQAALLVAGVVGELMDMNPEVTEPLLVAGAGLIAREAAAHFAQSKQASPAAVQGYSAPVAAPALAHPMVTGIQSAGTSKSRSAPGLAG